MAEQPNLMMLLQGLFWLAVIFVALRWLVLWYFKIGYRVRLQEETVALLRSINEQLGGQPIALPEPKLQVPTIPRSVKALRDSLAAKAHQFPKESA